jgi:MoxR-like ATPase
LVWSVRDLLIRRGPQLYSGPANDVIPQDVIEVIPDVLRHRLVLTYDALADEISSETVINRILQTVALPQVNATPQQGHWMPPMAQAGPVPGGR